MTPAQINRLHSLRRELLSPPDKTSVAEWCEQNLHLKRSETQSYGRLSWAGRIYLIEPLNSWSDYTVTDLVLCTGSQIGKTVMLMAAMCWQIANDPCAALWVLPNENLAKSFSRTRWQRVLKACKKIAALIPTGNERHSFQCLEQQIGGMVINFSGSNSAANLASRPARIVLLDEVDKFPTEIKKEADAVNLAEQRTKSFDDSKQVKFSTPTSTDGPIWQEYLKGDQRRRHLPCPFCKKLVTFAWSKEMTVLPTLGNEAFISWDSAARAKDGTWNMEAVRLSAHAVCPHCGGKILDSHKTAMDREGVWIPTATATAAAGFRSYHLSSLYACGKKTSFGALAVKFLEGKRSLLGLQGFINGALAEPWENQDSRSERLEVIAPDNKPPLEGALALMTVDCQASAPFYWVIVRGWSGAGHSRLVWAGHCDDWTGVRRIQTELKVADNHVCLDSGDRAPDVYENCLKWGQVIRNTWCGWTPSKGRDHHFAKLDPKTGRPRPWFLGRAELPPTQRIALMLLEFNGEFLLDILYRLRRGPKECGGFAWEICNLPARPIENTIAVDAQEYFRHMDAKRRMQLGSSRTGRVEWRWVLRSQRWPDHLLDCELMQLAFAMLHRRFPWTTQETTKP